MATISELVSNAVPESSATIIQGNIRGLRSYDRTKIFSLEKFAVLNNSIVIALSETHLVEEIEDNEIAMKGWSLFRADRCNRKCRGTTLYMKKS